MRRTAQPVWTSSGPAPTPPAGMRDWSFATPETVEWISRGIGTGRSVTSAIPPVFDGYATVVEVDDDAALVRQERAVMGHLAEYGSHVWWLGYLDTGAHNVVFPSATRVSLYWGWAYVFAEAGPEEALQWRDSLPDLIFPEDHSWLVSMLWDDDWTCVGGPKLLIDALVVDPLIDARRVGLDEDLNPPGDVPPDATPPAVPADLPDSVVPAAFEPGVGFDARSSGGRLSPGW
jgi:hypothetical protein